MSTSAPAAATKKDGISKGHPSSTPLERWKRRVRARATGRMSESHAISEAVAQVLIARARLPGTQIENRLHLLADACRRTTKWKTRANLHRMLFPYLDGEAAEIWRAKRIGWDRYYGAFGRLGQKRPLSKCLILKAPQSSGEKGVFYCPFEYNVMQLIAHHDARAVLSQYLLVGEASWSPTDYAAFANLAGLSEDPIFVGVANPADMEAYRVLNPVVHPVPLMASDWIDPRDYVPRAHDQREIDILMVANWSRFKRHWLLFEALRDMPRDLRVVLVGRNAPGRTEREIREEAKAFGAPQDIEYLTNIPIEYVTALQCDARVSLIFSHREGSCVAVAESLFADTPVAMMADGHVGAKSYINPKTGVLLRGERLALQLSSFLERSGSFGPREWAVKNISCFHSTARLNGILRDYSAEAGLPWTTEIVPFCRRYVPEYVRAEDAVRMQAAEQQLRDEHGVEIEKFVYRP